MYLASGGVLTFNVPTMVKRTRVVDSADDFVLLWTIVIAHPTLLFCNRTGLRRIIKFWTQIVLISMEKQYMSVKEVAQRLGYEPVTIYRYVLWGDLRAFKVGKEYRISQAEFDRFMAAHAFNAPYGL